MGPKPSATDAELARVLPPDVAAVCRTLRDDGMRVDVWTVGGVPYAAVGGAPGDARTRAMLDALLAEGDEWGRYSLGVVVWGWHQARPVPAQVTP